MNRRFDHLALIAILLLAAFLRFWNLDATEFKYDEATVCNLAAQFVDTGLPPVRGMGSSVGIDNPPMMIWLMSLPVLISRDPLIVSGFVALLNVIAVWGCYALGKHYWDERVGLLGALLLAVGPWAVFYSRKVWAQNVLLPFVLLFIYLLLAGLIDRRRWAWAWALVTLTAITQIHFSTLAFVPILVMLLVVELVRSARQKTLRGLWQPLALGAGLSFLLYAPYLMFDAAVGWRNVRALISLLDRPARLHIETINYALLNMGGREIHALAGAEKFRLWLNSIVDLHYLPDRIVEVLFVLSGIYLVIRLWRSRNNCRVLLRDGVLLLWLLTPIAIYLRSKTDVFPHYLILLYPAPYLAIGILATDLLHACRHLGTLLRTAIYGVAAVCLTTWVIWSSYLSLSIYAFVEVHDTPGGMGTPIGIYRQIVSAARRYAIELDNRQMVVLCSGDDPNYAECPAVWQFLLGRHFDLRFADYDRSLVFPAANTDTLVLLAPGASIAADQLPRYAPELATIWLRDQTAAYRFYRLPAARPAPAIPFVGIEARFENGTTLLGYDLLDPLRAGEKARLALYWQIDALPDNPPAQGYSISVNLIGQDGTRYAQHDGPGQRVELWRPGDLLISWFTLPLDPHAQPPYILRIGIYVYTPPDRFDTIHLPGQTDSSTTDALLWPIADVHE